MWIEEFPDRQTASTVAAGQLAAAMRVKWASDPHREVIIGVSGGSTPLACYRVLSAEKLNWANVRILLTDERVVPVTHDDSNEKMLRQTLLVGEASHASIVPLDASALAALSDAPAITLLGMGEDGHFASIFPDSPNRDAALDLSGAAMCLPMETAASTASRVSLTLSYLVTSETIVLLAFGKTKREILEDAGNFPVGHLLNQQVAPVRVLWAA